MRFADTEVSYDPSRRNTILDYAVTVNLLRQEDRILVSLSTNNLEMKCLSFKLSVIFFQSFGKIGNYSITGIEINFVRHKLKYLYVYYLPSGIFNTYLLSIT